MIRQINPDDIVVYEGKLYDISNCDSSKYDCVVLYYNVDTGSDGYLLEKNIEEAVSYYKDFCQEIRFKANPWHGCNDVAKIRKVFGLAHNDAGLEQALCIAHCSDMIILDPDDWESEDNED